jgi:di/tricarboxylate transporter
VGLTVVGILRGEETNLAIRPEEVLAAGDELVVVGDPTRVIELLELGELRILAEPSVATIESETVGLVEAVVAPRSSAAGETLADLHFRGRYGLQVLALWRSGRLISRELATLRLRFGDALLLHGPRKKISYLQEDPDFLVLGAAVEPPSNTEKAPVALGALALMIALVATGLYPIHVAAFAGAVVAVLFGALKMEEAYRKIEWKALFLVAAVLPVGGAMESSGAALFLADLVVKVASEAGPYALLLALAVLASLLSQGLDGAPTVVILAPVVMLTAEQLGLSPYPLMMVVGLAASAAFMTPFSHKANLLVMSAGGYRAMDYVRVGTPLTVVVLGLLVLLTPVFFPL